VPGAREWDSLARVRPRPQNLYLRRPPGGPNRDSCCGARGERASTLGRCASETSGAGALRWNEAWPACPPKPISGVETKWVVSMAVDVK